MNFLRKNIILFLCLILLNCLSCSKGKNIVPTTISNEIINFKHFNHLYEALNFKGKNVGIVHIYSNFPNYDYDIAPNEGFAAVDDVARAIIMLSKYNEIVGHDKVTISKITKLTEFVLQMQNKNGYFNNFIRTDLSINTTYKTSVANLNWWSLRALLSLETAYPLLASNTEITNRIELATHKLIENLKRDLPISNLKTEYIGGIELPTWLPQRHASDQAAVLMLGLLKNYKRTGDNNLKLMIDALAKGIMIMQKGGTYNYPYGAFLSWENLWHAWGNSQAYALLKVGEQFNNIEYINSALKEIDNFYPKILKTSFAESFWIKKSDTGFVELGRNKYPQISYGLRPMVWAATEAYHYSNNKKYLSLAIDMESWLWGNNDANAIIYDPSTGISFDGIDGPSQFNKNSGAESTIESLLILLEIN